jgi:hypothetical protein
MAVRDIFKVSRKTFFDPAAWIDYDGLKRFNMTLFASIKGLFVREEPPKQETFEEAKSRFNLSDEEIQSIATRYRLYAVFFAILGLVIFAYALYLLFSNTTLLGFILGLAVSGFGFAQAFRYDFWAFQIRRRQLGATFNDWKRHILGDKSTSP